MLQSFYHSIMVVDYQLNLPEYLAKCINKDKPELECHGQCVLMKKIEEKEKEDTKKNLLVYEYSSLFLHNEPTVSTKFQTVELVDQDCFSTYLNHYTFTFHTSIFHPPSSC